MIRPVTSPADICRRGWCQINIIQEVLVVRIAALELQSCQAAGRHKVREAEGTKARNRIEIFKNHYAVKEDTKSVVWRRAGVQDLIEKRQMIRSPRRSDKGLANRVKIGIIRSEVYAESIVGRWYAGDPKVTSGRRRCGVPARQVAVLEIAVNNEVGESWLGSGDQQNADREKKRG